jgi:hypothetical protein
MFGLRSSTRTEDRHHNVAERISERSLSRYWNGRWWSLATTDHGIQQQQDGLGWRLDERIRATAALLQR